MRRTCRAAFLLSLVFFLASNASAQVYSYHVYLDLDQSESTGCTISDGGQTFAGADFRLTATVTGSPAQISERRLAQCSGGSFPTGTALSAGYPAGLNNGIALGGGAEADVIELAVGRNLIPGAASQVRVGFAAESASGSLDSLFTANGQNAGPRMIVGLPQVIPGIGLAGIAILAMAMLGLAWFAFKRHRRLGQLLLLSACILVSMVVWAANFISDGEVGDWQTSSRLGTDAVGDPLPALVATDIAAAFGAEEADTLFFRLDVVDLENVPPAANDDAYSVLEDGVLTVPAPGVLGNDSDGDGDPISAVLVTGPSIGILTFDANGGFVYTPNADAAGTDSFAYNVFDGEVLGQNPATVTITVDPVNDAPVISVPGAQLTSDTVPLVFGASNANAISLGDVDAGAGIVRLSLATGGPANGTLTLANAGGLATLTGNGTDQVVATGSLAALNAALNGPSGSLTYTPVVGTSALRTITITMDDQGNTGSGGPLVHVDTISIAVDAAPTVSSTPADGAVVANNVALTVSFSEPVDVSTGVSLNCGGGELITGGSTGVSVNSLSLAYAAPLPAGVCTLAVPLTSVSDVDTIDPPDRPSANYIATFTVDALPAVESISPPSAATSIPTNATIQIDFNELVDIPSAAAFSVECPAGMPIGFTVTTPATLPASTATVILTPATALPAGTTCLVTAYASAIFDSDVADPPDAMLADFVSSFTTEAAPGVTATLPANGSSSLPTNTDVVIGFSEPVDVSASTFAMDCGATPVVTTLNGSGTDTITLDPVSNLPADSLCTVTVTASQVSDSDAVDPPDHMAADYVFSFSTLVDSAPTVIQGGIVPTATSGGPNTASLNLPVSTTPTISIPFSEPIDAATAAVTLNCPGAIGVTVIPGLPATNQTQLIVSPTAALPPGSNCALTVVAANISDTDQDEPPDLMLNNFTLTFSVDSAPTEVLTETEVAGVFQDVSGAGANNVDLDGDIRVSFDEPVSVSFPANGLQCPPGNNIPVTVVSNNAATIVLNPDTVLPLNTSCLLAIPLGNISDVDSADAPDNPVAAVNHTFQTVDDDAPTVTTNPSHSGSGIAPNANITVTFNEPVTLTGAWFGLNCTGSGGRVSTGELTGTGITIIENTPDLVYTIDPATNFSSGDLCTITIDSGNVVDNDLIDPPNQLDGNASLDTLDGDVDDYVAVFSTVDAAPQVSSSTPSNFGSVDQSQGVVLNFSEAVDIAAGAFAFTCNGSPLSGGFTTSATLPVNAVTSITLTPVNPLPSSGATTCLVTAESTAITDSDAVDPPNELDGNSSNDLVDGDADDFQLNFGVDTAPAISSAEVEVGNVFTSLPLNGTQFADVNTDLRLIFNEAVTLTGDWAQLNCSVTGIKSVAAGLAVTDADPVFGLNPATNLSPGESCTLTVFAAQVDDDDALDPPAGMTADAVYTFSVTDLPPQVMAPTVPANGATVADSQLVTIQFNELVDLAAGSVSFDCGAPVAFTPSLPLTNVSSITLTPSTALPAGSTCVVTLESTLVTDVDATDPPNELDGNASSDLTDGDSDDFVLTFSVDTPPAPLSLAVEVAGVPSFLPLGGGQFVDADTNIAIQFSESVDVTPSGITLECPAGSPVAFAGLPVSGNTSVVVNPTGDLPGGALCVVTLTHTGISDADSFDPPDMLDGNGDGTEGDSISFSFTTLSTANDDAYTVTPQLSFTSPSGVVANDNPIGATITGFGSTLATANGTTPNGSNFITAAGAGGRVVMNADGSFVFYPDAGDDTSDGVVTFFYTIAGGDTAQVTLIFEAEELVWFADQFPPASAVCTGTNTGTQACPAPDFVSSIAPNLTPSDVLFINSGAYQCGIALPNDVQVIGNGSSSSLDALLAAHVSPITPVAGSTLAPYSALNGAAPVLNTPAGDCFTLGQNNVVRGLNIANTPAGHAFQDGGGTIGTAALTEVSVSGSGGVLNIRNGGTLNATLGAVSSSSSPSAPILLTNVAGTLTQTGGGSVTHTGNFDLLDINGGNVGVSLSASLNGSGGNGSLLDVSGGHTGALTLTGNISSAASYAGDNLQFDNADGAYVFMGEVDLLAGSAGVNIQNGSGGSFATFNVDSSIENVNGTSFRVNASTMIINTAFDIVHTAQANRGVEIILGTGTTNFTGTVQIGTVGSPMLSATGVLLDDTGAANSIGFADLNIMTGVGGGAGAQAFVSQTSGRIAIQAGSIDCNGNLGADNHCFDVSNTTSSGVMLSSFLSDHDDAGENGGAIYLSNAPGTFTFSNVPRMTGNNAAIIQATNFGTLTVGSGSTGNAETSNRPVFDIDNGTINLSATTVRSSNSTTRGIDLSRLLGASSLAISGLTMIETPASVGVGIDNIASGSSLNFANLNITNRGADGILIQDHNGALLAFADVDINNGLNVGGNGVTVQKSPAAAASTGPIRFASLDISATNVTVNRVDAGADGIPDADTHDGHAVKLVDHVGGLTITGDGSQGNGGSLQNIEGDGISLTRSGGLDLDELTINNIGTANQASASVDNASIYAYQLMGSNQISNSTISRFQDGSIAGGNSGGVAVLNSGVSFTVLRSIDTTFFNDNALLGGNAFMVVTSGTVNGTVAIESAFNLGHVSNRSEFFQISGDAVSIIQNGAGTLTTTISDSTFRDTITPGGFGGLNLASAGSGTMSNVVDECLFLDLYPGGVNNSGVISLFASGTVDYDATVNNSVFGSATQRTSDGRGAIRASTDTDVAAVVRDFDITISNNVIDDTDREAISILPRGGAVPAASGQEMDFVITNNVIGSTTPVANDAGLGREGIEFVSTENAKVINLRLENNSVVNFVDSSSDETVDIKVNDNTSLNAIVRGNTFSQSGSTTDSIDISANTTGSICLDMNSANTSPNASPNGMTITETAGSFSIEDIGGAAIPAATVKTFVETRNTGVATVTGTFDSCNDH